MTASEYLFRRMKMTFIISDQKESKEKNGKMADIGKLKSDSECRMRDTVSKCQK